MSGLGGRLGAPGRDTLPCREAGLSSRVGLYERIRRDRRLEPGVSQRELARRHGVHRRTVRSALAAAVPPQRHRPVRTRALLLEPVAGHIDAMLRADLSAPRKQRHTIQRVYDRLLVEYDFNWLCGDRHNRMYVQSLVMLRKLPAGCDSPCVGRVRR